MESIKENLREKYKEEATWGDVVNDICDKGMLTFGNILFLLIKCIYGVIFCSGLLFVFGFLGYICIGPNEPAPIIDAFAFNYIMVGVLVFIILLIFIYTCSYALTWLAKGFNNLMNRKI